jgi:hypothetical protein
VLCEFCRSSLQQLREMSLFFNLGWFFKPSILENHSQRI